MGFCGALLEEGEYRRRVLAKQEHMRAQVEQREKEAKERRAKIVAQKRQMEANRALQLQQYREQEAEAARKRQEEVLKFMANDKAWRSNLNNKGAKKGQKWLNHLLV